MPSPFLFLSVSSKCLLTIGFRCLFEWTIFTQDCKKLECTIVPGTYIKRAGLDPLPVYPLTQWQRLGKQVNHSRTMCCRNILRLCGQLKALWANKVVRSKDTGWAFSYCTYSASHMIFLFKSSASLEELHRDFVGSCCYTR